MPSLPPFKLEVPASERLLAVRLSRGVIASLASPAPCPSSLLAGSPTDRRRLLCQTNKSSQACGNILASRP